MQATSHALQPMHVVVSVKKPIRSAPGRLIAISVIRCGSVSAGWSRLTATPGGVSCTPASMPVPTVLRPARTLQTNAFDSWIDTLGSPDITLMSFAESPGDGPAKPQCQGRPTWWTRAVAEPQRLDAVGHLGARLDLARAAS